MKGFSAEQLRVLQARPRITGSRIGSIVEIASERRALVDFPGNPFGPQAARAVSAMTAQRLIRARDAGWPVLLVFEDNDPARPVIVDVVCDDGEERPMDEVPAPEMSRNGHDTESSEAAIAGAVLLLARIVGVESDLVLVEDCSATSAPFRARTAIVLRNLKDPVLALRFPDGSAVLIGQLYPSVPLEPTGAEGAEVVLAGDRVRIEAATELILKAGACTVRLDARGKLVSTAEQIVSRARGANKVQGGSVQLN